MSNTTGPELVTAKMHLATPASPVTGTVVKNEKCTASAKSAGVVRHIELDVSGTALAGSFVSGQSFGVLPPGADSTNKPHKLRLYSLASPTAGEDGKGNIVATTVKRTIDEHWETGKLFLGVCSNYLCDCIVGDTVQLTGPSGKRFVLPAKAAEHDYVFVATGTGIAPFRGMLLDLLSNASTRKPNIALIMGSPYATDLLYHKELLVLAEQHRNFQYITAISREKQADGRPPMYVHDRLIHNADVLRPILESVRGLIYMCGIAGMELGVLQKLTSLPIATREQYIEGDAETIANPHSWTRQMLHKQVKPTRRVFMEVY